MNSERGDQHHRIQEIGVRIVNAKCRLELEVGANSWHVVGNDRSHNEFLEAVAIRRYDRSCFVVVVGYLLRECASDSCLELLEFFGSGEVHIYTSTTLVAVRAILVTDFVEEPGV